MADPWLDLDTELKERVREVLENPQRPITEAELRRIADKGRACTLILHGELERLEQRLDRLDSDPDSSLAAIADAFRRLNDFRAHVEELDGLLTAFEGRAREARTSWRRQVPARVRSEPASPPPPV
jgi:hypothetical protein